MKLELRRRLQTDQFTIGELFLVHEDGSCEHECYTLEPPVGRARPAVAGYVAIPAGTYPVTIDFSPKFMREMPHVLDVPGFSGVRIHTGNGPRDTEGCILVGHALNDSSDRIADHSSRPAYEMLFAMFQAAISHQEKIELDVVDDDAALRAAA